MLVERIRKSDSFISLQKLPSFASHLPISSRHSFLVFAHYIRYGQHQSIPIILDADALYFMAQLETQIKPPRTHDNWICTPHTGEAGRLLGISADAVTQDRLSAIKALKKRYGGSWILKGANTLSLHHNDDAVFVCPFGNAGMATAGMGDVLAGMMAGLCAQPLSPSLADMVSLHALAGDKLASQTPVVSACDMPNAIKQVIKTLTI